MSSKHRIGFNLETPIRFFGLTKDEIGIFCLGFLMFLFSSNKNLFPSFIIKYLYRNLDAIVCQSLDMKKDMQQLYSLNEKNTFIINNPAPDFKEFKRQSKRNNIFNPRKI